MVKTTKPTIYDCKCGGSTIIKRDNVRNDVIFWRECLNCEIQGLSNHTIPGCNSNWINGYFQKEVNDD